MSMLQDGTGTAAGATPAKYPTRARGKYLDGGLPARARSREGAAGQRAGEGAARDRDSAVDDHVGNPGREPVRIGERGLVSHRRRIQYDDVSVVAGRKAPAPREPERAGWQRGHPPDRLRQREHTLIPNVVPEHPGEAAVGPRMRRR